LHVYLELQHVLLLSQHVHMDILLFLVLVSHVQVLLQLAHQEHLKLVHLKDSSQQVLHVPLVDYMLPLVQVQLLHLLVKLDIIYHLELVKHVLQELLHVTLLLQLLLV